jgi:hypothetical protein
MQLTSGGESTGGSQSVASARSTVRGETWADSVSSARILPEIMPVTDKLSLFRDITHVQEALRP